MSGSGGAYFEYHYSLILPFVYFKKLADWYFGILYPFLDYSLRKLKYEIAKFHSSLFLSRIDTYERERGADSGIVNTDDQFRYFCGREFGYFFITHGIALI